MVSWTHEYVWAPEDRGKIMSILRRERRKIYSRKIKGFWEEFSHNKIGLFGLTLVMLYIFMAIFAPWLSPYDPIGGRRVAESYAMPDWVTLFPQYRDLPPTQEFLMEWQKIQESDLVDLEWGEKVVANFSASRVESVYVSLGSNFSYSYDPPKSFYFDFMWMAPKVENVSYSMRLYIVDTQGEEYLLWRRPSMSTPSSGVVHHESTDFWMLTRLGLDPGIDSLAKMAFSERGPFSLRLEIAFTPSVKNAACEISFTNAMFTIAGLVHGFLGTDMAGSDVFSQLIWGSRISLAIGLLSAILATSIGVIVGVVAGYSGGIVDEITMRIIDVLLCLPVLPLLLTLVFLFGSNVFYIVILIAVFGWQGLSRMIRSQVLSLRETAFIECAVASGANKYYIMFKHLVPNVLPIAFASLVLSVPGAILLEASLSFLGFGDPRAPTWGKMLHSAFDFGGFSALAWWWIIPPGLAITFLCLAFVFMGHAFDEIVNPRLRRRR